MLDAPTTAAPVADTTAAVLAALAFVAACLLLGLALRALAELLLVAFAAAVNVPT